MNRRLKTSLIFLMVISLSGCNYDPKGSLIKRWDAKLNVCRQYKMDESKPEMVFSLVATLPGKECDGIWGVDSPLFAKWIREWNAYWIEQEAIKAKMLKRINELEEENRLLKKR